MVSREEGYLRHEQGPQIAQCQTCVEGEGTLNYHKYVCTRRWCGWDSYPCAGYHAGGMRPRTMGVQKRGSDTNHGGEPELLSIGRVIDQKNERNAEGSRIFGTVQCVIVPNLLRDVEVYGRRHVRLNGIWETNILQTGIRKNMRALPRCWNTAVTYYRCLILMLTTVRSVEEKGLTSRATWRPRRGSGDT